MAYQLKNGIVIDTINWATPTVGSPGAPTLKVNKNNPMASKIIFSSGELDAKGRTAVPAVQATAVVKPKGSIPTNENVRFAQVVKMDSWQVEYYGAKPEDGSTVWFYKGDYIKQMLDCTTDPVDEDFSDVKVNEARDYPFYSLNNTTRSGNGLILSMDDTPGGTLPLVVENRSASSKLKPNNYLARFFSSARFSMVLIYVHADNTYEPLEKWDWTCDRQIDVVWNKGAPSISGSPSLAAKVAATQESVFNRLDFSALVKQRQVINTLTNFSTDVRNDPNIFFHEFPTTAVPAGFWTFQ